ncbi:Chromatin assembly factor 1 subunit A [Dirofilaria immitis]|nr:Chromatin assembly factor 1 subunit A [Dirofilaria immitis]
MDMNGDDVNKYSAQRHEKVQQYTDEVVASEVNDFVREVIEAVTYIIDHRKTSCRHGKHAVGEHVMTFELNDRDSVIGNPRKKRHGPYRMEICLSIDNKRDVVIEERRRQKEEAQKYHFLIDPPILCYLLVFKLTYLNNCVLLKLEDTTERGTEAVQISSVLNVLPFFCKQGVSLAPIFRRKPLSKEVHDSLLMDVQSVERPYLSTVKPRDVGKVKLNRAKLFQFHDNWRPPYYGTWRKRSTVITGRKPFVKDTKVLDYEIDSDEEWEIPEGDDCDQSTMSDEDEEDSDHSIDNDGFIVQHGYLSEGEGEDEEDRLEHHEDSSKRAERLKAMEGVPEEVEQAIFFEYSDGDDNIDDYDDKEGDGGSDNSRDDIYIED